MSSSDQDTSASSATSPQSYYVSPNSSPLQRVNLLDFHFSEITLSKKENRPYLWITEQPQEYFRFRYSTEMTGTHGCIFGRSHTERKTKSHPAVELVNYTGRAVIRCCLAQCGNDEEHPHMLNINNREICKEVPEKNCYNVAFPDLGVIHISKEKVTAWWNEHYRNSNFYESNMNNIPCKELMKRMEMNKVRLKFSAHDQYGSQICEPVFSEPIFNLKSAATNDLKICRISKYKGDCAGGDDVIMLVEKVNKHNIKVRFFEMKDGVEVWSDFAHFMPTDVHHQYAICFRTPKYKDSNLEKDVNVFIELVRPRDNKKSEPIMFIYAANNVFKQRKKRRMESSLSSLSSSDNSLRSLSELPLIAENTNTMQTHEDLLGDALTDQFLMQNNTTSEVLLSQPNVPEQPFQQIFNISSTELSQIMKSMDKGFNVSDLDRFVHESVKEYIRVSLSDQAQEKQCVNTQMPEMNMGGITFSDMLISDSGRPKDQQSNKNKTAKETMNNGTLQYDAFYSDEDKFEVRKLVKEVCDSIRKPNKNDLRTKLERLFELRLSNGDTYLHMALCTNQVCVEYLVKIVNSVKATNLLNLQNNMHQTVLHLAILYDMPNRAKILVENGCDPMIKDNESNTAFHYAVKYQNCLEELLAAVKKGGCTFDLNAQNFDKQTPLHLAAVMNSAQSTKILMANGASCNVGDRNHRTPLHLAACDGHWRAMKEMLQFIHPDDIDAADGQGNTALQIVCQHEEDETSIEVVELLLEKSANPLLQEGDDYSAWKLAQGKPRFVEVIKQYIPEHCWNIEDIKSEPEDEYESADEGIEGLPELSNYIDELCNILDNSNAWSRLAMAFNIKSPLIENKTGSSPTRYVLLKIRDSVENVKSTTLASILESIGEAQAAEFIRKSI